VKAEATTHLRSAALDAAADAVSITDRHGAIEWVNAAFTTMTGYALPEALGHNHREITRSGEQDQEQHRKLREAMAAGRVWRGEMTNRRRDGAPYPVDLAITPIKGPGDQVSHFVAIERDLTESKRLEAQFIQAQKMELVGRLAGGVAHDFNNLLTVISGTCDLLLMTMSASDEVRADLRQIQEAGRRAAALTRQLLAFGRKQILNAENIDLGATVSELRKTLARLIGEDLVLVVDAPAGVSHIRADPSQIEQVLMNLAINARDAMPDGGSLTIRTANIDLDDSRAAELGVPPGPYVACEVADTGAGMDPAIRDRIFEPFFTTKEPGRGTGLGLSTVLGIVQQSAGAVHVESEPGRGTTVSIYLPRIHPDAPADDDEVVAAGAPAGRETILVVEDEEPLRLLAGRILAAAGYEVLTVGDAAAALEMAARHRDPIHLLFTDVVLPGINGRQLAEQVMARHPGIVVLFTSGYTEDAILRHGVHDEGTPFISKPYTAARLTRAVRSLLDAAARRTPGS
jgi:PAS domain S-box-containing protein